LGLSIAKALTEAMGGQIGFFPTPGGGSTFFFELPVASPKVAANPSTASEGVLR
jgi:signal transduction histidine kinase